MLLALPMRWVRRWGWASPVVPLRPSTAAVGAAVGGAGFGGQGTALRAGRDCAALRSVGRCGGRALTGAKPLGAPRLRCGTGRDSVPLRFATLHYARPALACRRAPSPPLRPTALLPPSLRLLAPPDPPLAPPRLRRPRLPCHLPAPGRDFAPIGPLPPIAVGKERLFHASTLFCLPHPPQPVGPHDHTSSPESRRIDTNCLFLVVLHLTSRSFVLSLTCTHQSPSTFDKLSTRRRERKCSYTAPPTLSK